MANHPKRLSAARVAQVRRRRLLPKRDCLSAIACPSCVIRRRVLHRPRISGPGLRNEAAKTPLTLLVFSDRQFKRTSIEIRPIGRNEHQFTVCSLPKQEIGKALFAAGADDEIWI